MQNPSLTAFKRKIWNYYENHGRDLPWRNTRDPYAITVSEIMLQQTQVSRVLLKYPSFLAAFPDFSSLAKAPLHRVLTEWQGMGYNRRAVALKKLAEIVINEYGGRLPKEPESLIALPGIGKATAGSIPAFAWNIPVPFIETNIRRVFIHFFFPGRSDVPDSAIYELVQNTLDKKRPREWYYALMDYGSMLGKTLKEGYGGNPNKRSKAYKLQAKFDGSERQLRGRILKLVLSRKQWVPRTLASMLKEPITRVHKTLGALEREGFILRKGSAVLVSR